MGRFVGCKDVDAVISRKTVKSRSVGINFLAVPESVVGIEITNEHSVIVCTKKGGLNRRKYVVWGGCT